jgi:hypothetical protein
MKMSFIKYIKSYLPVILIVVVILVYNFSTSRAGKQIEGLENDLSTDPAVSFCNKFGGDSSQLEGACGRLTDKNCKSSNCCVFTNGNKCSAGGITGPTFKTDKDGNKITVDNYYYMNKCYGNGCTK